MSDVAPNTRPAHAQARLAQGASLVCWGDVGWDEYPEGHVRPGGCAGNVASAAALAGAGAVEVIGAVGNDGAELRRELRRRGVGVGGLRDFLGFSSRQPIRLAHEGERELHGYRAGVLADFPLDEELVEDVRGAGLVYVPTFEQNAHWARLALREGVVALDLMDLQESLGPTGDPASEDWLESAFARAALVFCGLTPDHPQLERVCQLARASEALVVVTLGADGCLLLHGSLELRQPAAPVPGGVVVDTTGCGDAFAGTFLARWAAGEALESCLQAASEAAARVASFLGAQELAAPA